MHPANRWIKFSLAVICVGAVWLAILPRLANWTPVREHIDRMQAAEIEVDAMFYSELSHVPGL